MVEEAHGVCKLLIYKPSNKDSGAYICKAINSSGEAEIRHTVEIAKNRHFHVPGIFHARGRIHEDKEKTAKKAMEAAMKSKQESDSKRAEVEEEQKKIKVARASPEPPPVPVKQKLKFATQLRDRMALEGTTVKFVCTVIGPSPACRWMKDDKWVVVGGNIRNLSDEGKAVLEVSKVTSADSGVYKCVAKNDFSEIETSCYFKVYAAQAEGDQHEPMFALPLRGIIIWWHNIHGIKQCGILTLFVLLSLLLCCCFAPQGAVSVNLIVLLPICNDQLAVSLFPAFICVLVFEVFVCAQK